MKSKKLLSIILALAMMFSVLPASTVLVYADEITETISADTTWNDGDTVGGVTISGGTGGNYYQRRCYIHGRRNA